MPSLNGLHFSDEQSGPCKCPQSMFAAKNNVYPCKPYFFLYKVGIKGN